MKPLDALVLLALWAARVVVGLSVAEGPTGLGLGVGLGLGSVLRLDLEPEPHPARHNARDRTAAQYIRLITPQPGSKLIVFFGLRQSGTQLPRGLYQIGRSGWNEITILILHEK